MRTNFKIMTKTITIGFVLTTLTGCAALLEQRSYIDEMERESDGFFVAGRDFPVTNGDTGEAFRSRAEIKRRTPASTRSKEIEKEKSSLEQELQEKVAQLYDESLQNYYRDTKYLESDSERLYYLSMSGSERTEYINTKITDLADEETLKGDSREFLKRRSVHSRPIAQGMTKDDVMELWGKPTRVEVAGHPKFENERWSFFEGSTVKFIYFESGKVQGWSLDF